MTEFKPYDDCYKTDVAKCLIRNFKRFQGKDIEWVKKWFSPIVNYPWLEEVQNLHEWTRGVVVIDGEKVVGFFGIVFSIQQFGSQKRTVINPSTWAVDKEYRIAMFAFLKKLHEIDAIIVDYTPRESVRKILTQMFHYVEIDSIRYSCKLKPAPSIFAHVNRVTKHNASPMVKKELIDHILYGVKVACLSHNTEKVYVYYKITKETAKNFMPVKIVNIVKVTEPSVMGKHANVFLWKLMLLERAVGVTIDSRMIGGVKPSCTRSSSQIHRLVFGANLEEVCHVNMLYTEMVILDGEL